MINYKKIIFIFLSFFIILTSESNNIKGEEKEVSSNLSETQSIFCVSIGYPMSTNSYEFFENYKYVIEGTKSNFETTFLVYISYKFIIYDNLKLGFSLENFRAFLNDAFIQEVTTIDEKFYRSITENITLSSYPGYFTIEYFPSNLQFSSYIGFGLGLDLTHIKWFEKLESSNITDKRKGGLHFDNIILSPACRFYSGLELGFDRYTENMTIRSFHLEFNITYSIRRTNLFKSISGQFDNEKHENINKNFTIIPIYFGLNIGVSFNMYKSKLN